MKSRDIDSILAGGASSMLAGSTRTSNNVDLLLVAGVGLVTSRAILFYHGMQRSIYFPINVHHSNPTRSVCSVNSHFERDDGGH